MGDTGLLRSCSDDVVSFVDAVFFCALSVALGGIAPPVVAGVATVFCRLMPAFARPFLADPRPWVHWLASAGYYLAPAGCRPACSGRALPRSCWPRATASMRRCW